MKKKEKLFEPIRRGASSLPSDFTEELKEMEIVLPFDYYGGVIDDYNEWKRQREEYIEELYKQLKNGEEYEKSI